MFVSPAQLLDFSHGTQMILNIQGSNKKQRKQRKKKVKTLTLLLHTNSCSTPFLPTVGRYIVRPIGNSCVTCCLVNDVPISLKSHRIGSSWPKITLNRVTVCNDKCHSYGLFPDILKE